MCQTYLELSALSPEQTFCNESFSFFNDLTIQDGVSDFEIRNQANKPQKRNREKHEGGKEGEEGEVESKEGGGEALKYRNKKKSEAEKLKQKVNDLEEKNKLLKNKVNELSKEFLELRDFSFAVGLGAADVVIPLVTDEIWFKVYETVEIRFVGKNFVSVLEEKIQFYMYLESLNETLIYCPGLKYLSCDARFTISNMATEFGGIAGVFEVDSLVALYPSPDNVVPAKTVEGKNWMVSEEDLILAALVLEGLKKEYRSSIGGKRRVTPGSLPIIAILVKTETLETGWYVFGKGAIGNLASTATVAASSFEMKIKDPRELIDLIDPEKHKEFFEQWLDQGASFVISKPNPALADPNNPSSLGSDLPPPPPSFTGSITGKVQVFEDNVVTEGGCIV
ncbi:hypothetical protein Glove_256g31 [Diversispora epigaea]|uniref:Aconitase/3-isopropylmalate dehydratase large subunit alpha/beta/alpha domain-containing protein n=1 Tax=Diversispora epigaea TaxID=1348612 RepID=A0A397IFS2_9GLOM|nr:hypothetical protein Glove_256g31 [Diversispora epigaea]